MSVTPPKSPSFSRRPVAVAPASGPLRSPNGPPLRAGQTYVSDDVRKQLAVVGWRDGDDIPEQLPTVLADIQQRYGATKQEIAAVGGTTRLSKPKSINIADLPPEARQEIQTFLEQSKVLASQAAKQAEVQAKRDAMVPPNASESVRAAIEKHADKLVVIDDDEEPLSNRPLPVAAAAAEPPPQPADDTPAVDPVCPQCGYDCRVPFDIVITPQDTMAHTAAMLDPSPTSRFRKAVAFFDGKLTVVFRSLLTREAEAARLQTRKDVMDGLIVGEAEYYMNLFAYRLAMGIEKVLDKDGAPTVEIPPFADIPDEEGAENKLRRLVEYVDAEVLHQESLKHLVGQHHRRFGRLIEALEAQSADPNFCLGTETLP